MFSFLIYADETTLSSTQNMFNDNKRDKNLEFVLHEELIKKSEWDQNTLSITKCSTI